MAVLVGILLGLSRLASDSEITAMRAAGMGAIDFVRIVSIVSAVALALGLFNSLYLAPRGAAGLIALGESLKSSQASFEVQPRVFYEEFKNRVLYVQDATSRRRSRSLASRLPRRPHRARQPAHHHRRPGHRRQRNTQHPRRPDHPSPPHQRRPARDLFHRPQPIQHLHLHHHRHPHRNRSPGRHPPRPPQHPHPGPLPPRALAPRHIRRATNGRDALHLPHRVQQPLLLPLRLPRPHARRRPARHLLQARRQIHRLRPHDPARLHLLPPLRRRRRLRPIRQALALPRRLGRQPPLRRRRRHPPLPNVPRRHRSQHLLLHRHLASTSSSPASSAATTSTPTLPLQPRHRHHPPPLPQRLSHPVPAPARRLRHARVRHQLRHRPLLFLHALRHLHLLRAARPHLPQPHAAHHRRRIPHQPHPLHPLQRHAALRSGRGSRHLRLAQPHLRAHRHEVLRHQPLPHHRAGPLRHPAHLRGPLHLRRVLSPRRQSPSGSPPLHHQKQARPDLLAPGPPVDLRPQTNSDAGEPSCRIFYYQYFNAEKESSTTSPSSSSIPPFTLQRRIFATSANGIPASTTGSSTTAGSAPSPAKPSPPTSPSPSPPSPRSASSPPTSRKSTSPPRR